MKPRRILFWMHLCAGVTAGLVILIMSVTGTLLGYERQIVNWSVRDYRSTPPSSEALRLSPDILLAKARESETRLGPASLTMFSDPQMPASVRFGRDVTVYLNPYTGTVLGQNSKKLQSFFSSVESWHRWLGAKVENRATWRTVTGISNLLFMVLVFSGPFLWWPRSWTPAALRNITFFRTGLSGRARDFNWHNTIGLWCAIPLMFIVLSGVVMSFPWANNTLYRLSGSPIPPRPTPGGPANNANRPEKRQGRGTASTDERPTNFDALWARAEQQVPGWQSITMRVPNPSEGTAAFTIDQGDGGRPDQRATLTLDLKTAGVVRWEPFSSFNRGRQMRAWIRFGHTGEAGGVPGETVAVIASLGAAFLVGTGLALAVRHLFGWRASRSGSAAAREDRIPEMAASNRIGD